MRTSIVPKTDLASSMVELIVVASAATSSVSHLPLGVDSISLTYSGVRDGLREVAMTLWPCAKIVLVRVRPKPEELPVTSQVRDFAADIALLLDD